MRRLSQIWRVGAIALAWAIMGAGTSEAKSLDGDRHPLQFEYPDDWLLIEFPTLANATNFGLVNVSGTGGCAFDLRDFSWDDRWPDADGMEDFRAERLRTMAQIQDEFLSELYGTVSDLSSELVRIDGIDFLRLTFDYEGDFEDPEHWGSSVTAITWFGTYQLMVGCRSVAGKDPDLTAEFNSVINSIRLRAAD